VVPDDHTVEAVVTLPEVNLDDSRSETCAGFAVLVTERTSIGGPPLVAGPLQVVPRVLRAGLPPAVLGVPSRVAGGW
jgi:hypothetical protein